MWPVLCCHALSTREHLRTSAAEEVVRIFMLLMKYMKLFITPKRLPIIVTTGCVASFFPSSSTSIPPPRMSHHLAPGKKFPSAELPVHTLKYAFASFANAVLVACLLIACSNGSNRCAMVDIGLTLEA
jgi:hypothetical protein